jgi:hypothetical protein
MDRTERLYSFAIMLIIVLSIPMPLTEIIPRPYDWLLYLVYLALAIIILILPLVKVYKKNLGFFWFALGSVLLLPLSISNCGILHHTFPEFIKYESIFDWSIKEIIAVFYLLSLVTLYKKLKNN